MILGYMVKYAIQHYLKHTQQDGKATSKKEQYKYHIMTDVNLYHNKCESWLKMHFLRFSQCLSVELHNGLPVVSA